MGLFEGGLSLLIVMIIGEKWPFYHYQRFTEIANHLICLMIGGTIMTLSGILTLWVSNSGDIKIINTQNNPKRPEFEPGNPAVHGGM